MKACYNESRDTIKCIACVGFQPSNICYKPLIYLFCKTLQLKKDSLGISIEIQDPGNLLVCSFWDRNIDYIIDTRFYDANQLSYLVYNSLSILKNC